MIASTCATRRTRTTQKALFIVDRLLSQRPLKQCALTGGLSVLVATSLIAAGDVHLRPRWVALATATVLWKERIIERVIPSKERELVRTTAAFIACVSAAETSLARVPESSKSAQLGEGCLSAE